MENERKLKKNSRRLLFGVQLKYTFAPVLWLTGSVLVILTGMFLYNWFTKVADAEYEVSFLEQLQALPLTMAFFVLVLGVQIILAIGFAKMERNVLAMNQIPLSREEKALLRWNYSFWMNTGIFFTYFLMLCLLLLLDNLLSRENAYGFLDLYPALYRFRHLYLIYPIDSVWRIPVLLGCITAVSVIAPVLAEGLSKKTWKKVAVGVLCGWIFLIYFIEKSESPVWNFVSMVLLDVLYIGNLVFLYWRREKDDKAEVVEWVE